MKKIALLTALLLLIGVGFSTQSYTATMATPLAEYGEDEEVAVYGFITHMSGEQFYSLSDFSVKIFDPSVGPSNSYEIKATGDNFEFYSDYAGTDDIVVDGAFVVKFKTNSLVLTDGKTYNVALFLGDKMLALTSFKYDENVVRSGTTSAVSYMGLSDVVVSVTLTGTAGNVYDVNLLMPTRTEMDRSVGTAQLQLQDTTDSTIFNVPQSNLRDGPTIVVATANDGVSDATPTVFVVDYSGQKTITIQGNLTIEDCTAKENEERTCKIKVTNNGEYPARYSINVDSPLDISASLPDILVQPGSTIEGLAVISAKSGDYPYKVATFTLKSGDIVVDTVSKTINVEPRDLVDEVSLKVKSVYPEISHPGDEVTIDFTVENVGDFESMVLVQYKVDDESYVSLGGLMKLEPGDSREMTLRLNAPEESTLVSLRVVEDGEVKDSIVHAINVEPYIYTPYLRWSYGYKYVSQGNTTENTLKVRNEGNTATLYEIDIDSQYASLHKSVYLAPGDEKTFEVPIVVRDDAKPGVYDVEATVCTIDKTTCETESFQLTVIEKEVRNTTVMAVDKVEVEKDEAPIFRIDVVNNEGRSGTYTIGIGNFNGEYKVTPESMILLDGENGTFFLMAQPENEVTQNITYTVLMDGKPVAKGNLTAVYSGGMLSGLMTLSRSGSIGAIILGTILIAGLAYIGVRSFNQSKVELKYWK